MADRIVVLNGGKIEQVGAPLELYNKPQSLFVPGFLGSPRMNFFDGTVAAISATEIAVTLPGLAAPIAVKPDDDVTLPHIGANAS